MTAFATRTVRQLSALGLAALATLSLLGSIDLLATPPASAALVAATPATVPLQLVVIEGKRLART